MFFIVELLVADQIYFESIHNALYEFKIWHEKNDVCLFKLYNFNVLRSIISDENLITSVQINRIQF